mgnify:CR=1 FL=1
MLELNYPPGYEEADFPADLCPRCGHELRSDRTCGVCEDENEAVDLVINERYEPASGEGAQT